MTTHLPTTTNPLLLQAVNDNPLDLTRLLYMLYIDMDSLIRQADTKAQIALGVDTVLLATTTPLIAGLGGRLLDVNAAFSQRVGALLSLLVIVTLLISVYFALATASPRIKITQNLFSPFFFGSIAALDQSTFVQQFLGLSIQDVKISVLKEIHAKSQIVQAKFTAAQWSVRFLLVSVFLIGISRLLLAFG